MSDLNGATGLSGDLFGAMPKARVSPGIKRSQPPELAVARALCRQLRRKRAAREKQRIAHLICLNLLSLLKHSS